jgi:xyloglucan:xyloglucosyl transferase
LAGAAQTVAAAAALVRTDMGRLTPAVVVALLVVLAAVSGLPAINVTTMAFEDAYAPLFGTATYANILRSADHGTDDCLFPTFHARLSQTHSSINNSIAGLLVDHIRKHLSDERAIINPIDERECICGGLICCRVWFHLLVHVCTSMHGFFSASIKLPSDCMLPAFLHAACRRPSATRSRSGTTSWTSSSWATSGASHGGCMQTNVYGNGGVGRGREERYLLPFDPSREFLRYSILWTVAAVSFYVDDASEVRWSDAMDGDFPSKPMSVYTPPRGTPPPGGWGREGLSAASGFDQRSDRRWATKAGGGGKMVFSRAKLGLPCARLRWQAHVARRLVGGLRFCMAIL